MLSHISCSVKSVPLLLARTGGWCCNWKETFSKTYMIWEVLDRRQSESNSWENMQGRKKRQNKFNFYLKCIFRNCGNQHGVRFRSREILIISSHDGCLSCNARSDYLFSSWFPQWWSEDQAAGRRNWDPVPCVQSGVGIYWQYITLLILLHGLHAVPTCWDAFNSCADFDLSFYFPWY